MASTQFAYRSAKNVGIYTAHPEYSLLKDFCPSGGNLRCSAYSPNGSRYAYATEQDVNVVVPGSGVVECVVQISSVYDLAFSPNGTYLMTWERPYKVEDGNLGPNLKLWNLPDGKLLTSFVQKSPNGWKLQFTSDEVYYSRLVTHEVQFFESTHPERGVVNKLRVEGIGAYAVSPGKNNTIAAFIPERKGAPAVVRIYQLPNLSQHLAQKMFFKADKIQLKWNDLGTALLAVSQTEVDSTNKSYYGESNLYLLSITGNYDCRVALDKEGPIHDVHWSPNSKEFGVVYGYMPARTTIFDHRANLMHYFGQAARNTILFSPHGRLILVAGFGNLQGTMDIYDQDQNLKKLCTFEASNSSVCAWSPDGRFIMTGTTSPRLRVDNGVKIWHWSGELIFRLDMQELYNLEWRPRPPNQFPQRHQLSPPPTPHTSITESAVKTPSKPTGAYRPPHARNGASTFVINKDDDLDDIIAPVQNGNAQNVIPGFQPVEKQDTRDGNVKRKKKREANDPFGSAADTFNTGTLSNKQPPGLDANYANRNDVSILQKNDAPGRFDSPEAKKARSLMKKLRAIEELRLREASGEILEANQRSKMASEDVIIKQLEKLNVDT